MTPAPLLDDPLSPFLSSVPAYLVGYGVALLGGHFLISHVVLALWRDAGWLSRPASETRLSGALGFVERTAYLTAIALGHAQFIALWLGIKTAGTWSSWQNGLQRDALRGLERDISGRQIFNIFLVGNALNVLFAALGERMIAWVVQDSRPWTHVAALAVLALLLSLALVLYVRRGSRRR